MITSPSSCCKGGLIDSNLTSSKLLTMFVLLDSSTGNPTLVEESNNTQRFKNKSETRPRSPTPSGAMPFSTSTSKNVKFKVIHVVYNRKIIPLYMPRYTRFDINIFRSLDLSALDQS